MKILQFLLMLYVVFYSWSAFAQSGNKWVGTWSTAEQLVETANMPPSPGLTNNTLRQIVRVSIGGDTLRLKFSNQFSTSPVTINSAYVAMSAGGSAIDASTLKQLKFSGKEAVTMAAGDSSVFSDPVAFNLAPRMTLAITIYFGNTSSTVTGHPGSRTTSFLITGNKASSTDFSGAIKTEHWDIINSIYVLAPNSAAAVAILGNSITDGKGSVTDSQNRWPDILSERLLNNQNTQHVGVLNLGIGGNCVLDSCLGQAGVKRYNRDILDQPGVAWVIIFEGVNDIGGVTTASLATSMANNLIDAYKRCITDAHEKGLKVYGATIMPFKGNSYYNQYSESCRQTVNKWIRTGGIYDSVIDFDKITRSTSDTAKLGIASYQNDGLHPTAEGYKLMGESIDLNLFTQKKVRVLNAEDQKSYTGLKINSDHLNGKISISFDLSKESVVSLKVYSMLGTEVAELVGKKLSSGKHTVAFNCRNVAKAMYLYVLKVDKTYFQIKKII